MAGETVITIIGNLTNDPELRWTQSGAPVADFTVASTPRSFDRQSGEWKDGETLFMRCSVWREMAENVGESLRKGLRRAKAQVTRTGGPASQGGAPQGGYSQGGGYGQQQGYGNQGGYSQGQASYGAPAGGSQDDPWRTSDSGAATSFAEDPPF